MDEYPLIPIKELLALHFMGWDDLTAQERKAIYGVAIVTNRPVTDVYLDYQIAVRPIIATPPPAAPAPENVPPTEGTTQRDTRHGDGGGV